MALPVCLFSGENVEMEKKKDVKRAFTIAALAAWLIVSLIGTYFYIDFGGALGD